MFRFLFWPLTLIKWLIFILLGGIVLLSGVLTVMGFFGERGWLWDLVSHFRLIYVWIQLLALFVIALPVLIRRKAGWFTRLLLGGLLVFIALNLSQILPYYLPQLPVETGPGRVKILHSNVLHSNDNAEALAALIAEKDPDILTLAEDTPAWKEALGRTGALARFPYRKAVPYSMDTIYSKAPFEKVDVHYMSDGQDATTRLDMRLLGEPVTLLVVHPINALWRGGYERQLRHFAHWGQARASYRENLILVGDLNSAPWSSFFRRLIRETGLRDSQRGFGIQPSWPRRLPRTDVETPPLLPIDHVLVSERFVVLKREVGPDVGSDHLPVYVELGLRKQ